MSQSRLHDTLRLLLFLLPPLLLLLQRPQALPDGITVAARHEPAAVATLLRSVAAACRPEETGDAGDADSSSGDDGDDSAAQAEDVAQVSPTPPLFAPVPAVATYGSDPLQTYNDNLWQAIRMPQRARRVHVAIIDGPVRADHPDLPPLVHIAPQPRQADGSCGGVDCCPRVQPPAPSWHATRVAGIVAALRENGIGIAGVGEVGELVSIVTNVDGDGGDLRLAAALRCAVEYRGADGEALRIVNMSVGLQRQPRTPQLREALQAASDAGLLLVASAGNSGSDIARTPRWPASFNADTMLTVEARRYDGALSKNSNRGFGTVDIGAPAPERDEGPTICSTDVAASAAAGCAGDYAHFDRTSAAAAVVSGAAALVWRDPRFAGCSALEVRQLLLRTRSHCRYPADPAQAPICMLDLSFLSDPFADADLCAHGPGG